MLRLCPIRKASKESFGWKVVVYDSFCKNVLSTIFKVGTLRDLNITLHLNINSRKEQIKGINTIYFVCPTKENYEAIATDILEKKLYDNVFVYLSHGTSMQEIEGLAK